MPDIQCTIDDLLARFPAFSVRTRFLSDGPYTIATDFGLYLLNGIENRTLDSRQLDNAFSFLNCLGRVRDSEVHNLLAVGILEVLTDTNRAIAVARRKLNGNALRSFEEVLRFLERDH